MLAVPSHREGANPSTRWLHRSRPKGIHGSSLTPSAYAEGIFNSCHIQFCHVCVTSRVVISHQVTAPLILPAQGSPRSTLCTAGAGTGGRGLTTAREQHVRDYLEHLNACPSMELHGNRKSESACAFWLRWAQPGWEEVGRDLLTACSSLKDSYKDGGAKLLVHRAMIMDGSLVVSGWIREHSFTTRVRQVNRNLHPRRSVGIRWREQCQTRACAGTILRPAGHWSRDTSMALQLAGAVRVPLLLLECHRVTDLWPEVNFDDSLV